MQSHSQSQARLTFVNCSQNGQLGLYQNQCTFQKIHSFSTGGAHSRVLAYIAIASFPGSSAWAERKEPGTHCLRMLSSPRISGNLEISVKSAPLHQPPQGMPTSPA